MPRLRYAVHAYAWTNSWSNDTLGLIDHAKALGFDLIEIPLMELDRCDPDAIRARCESVGLGVCTSTACSDATDPTGEDAPTREAARRYLIDCVRATAAMGATTFSGVIYSAIGRKIEAMPDESYWQRSVDVLRDVARAAQDCGVTIGIEPINRYETFLVNTTAQGLRLREMIGEPNVALHLDAYHMNIEEDTFYGPTLAAAPHLCHFHMSESHRGTPGRGVCDWRAIYRALAESNYAGVVGLESFLQVSDAMRAATCVWRPMSRSSDALLSAGLDFLRRIEREEYGRCVSRAG